MDIYRAKYGEVLIFDRLIRRFDDVPVNPTNWIPDFNSGTSEVSDCRCILDFGTVVDLENLPTPVLYGDASNDDEYLWRYQITPGELECKRLIVYSSNRQAGNNSFADAFMIETYGHADALYPCDPFTGASGPLLVAANNTTPTTITLDGVQAVASVTGDVGGKVTGAVGSVAANGITSASFAADAIAAGAIKADAVTKIQSGLSTLSKADVNAECDTALADAGVNTITMSRIDAAISTRLADEDYVAPPTAEAIALAYGGGVLETDGDSITFTRDEALRIIAAEAAGKTSKSDDTINFYAIAGHKIRITAAPENGVRAPTYDVDP